MTTNRSLNAMPPPTDLNYLHERMKGLDGQVILHFSRDGGLRIDKVEIRLFEAVQTPYTKTSL